MSRENQPQDDNANESATPPEEKPAEEASEGAHTEADKPEASPSDERSEGTAEAGAGAKAAEPTKPEARPPRLLPNDLHIVMGLLLPMILAGLCMWRMHEHTVDDAFISYRYARNLARGWGLVFNEGERIEGYTNFLFTVMLAAVIRCGGDPDIGAKVIGGISGLGSIALTFAISSRLAPRRLVPVLSTWLLGGSAVAATYAMLGLETSFFVCLLLLATWLFLRERDDPKLFPWSGVPLALAGLTRPEAPMFAGLLMLFLAGKPGQDGAKIHPLSPIRDLFERRNLIRAAIFVLPVAAHVAFRKAYYGEWLPNTFAAKTGNLEQQTSAGLRYVRDYGIHAGPVLVLALGGVGLAIARRRRDLGALIAIALSVVAYVILVGGDWMPLFRFMAAAEPFAFLLIDAFVRPVAESKGRIAAVAVGVFAVYTGWSRGRTFNNGARLIENERKFWTSAAGGVASWFDEHGQRGTIAVADMGYIAYSTDYPILDLLGLVDPVISKLPGGYTRKTGAGYVERAFQVMPRYFVFVGGADTCQKLPFPQQARLKNDPRFRARYELVGQVRHTLSGYWCIFGARDGEPLPQKPQLFR